MQVYYINNIIDKNRIIAKHQSNMDAKMKPLTRLIIDSRLKSKKECDEYVKKLAVDIIAYYALGNPENTQVSDLQDLCAFVDFFSVIEILFEHKNFLYNALL